MAQRNNIPCAKQMSDLYHYNDEMSQKCSLSHWNQWVTKSMIVIIPVFSSALLFLQSKPRPSVGLLCDDQHSVGDARCNTLHTPTAQSQALRILN